MDIENNRREVELYFKKSKTKTGEECYISKIKGEDGMDEIVIANLNRKNVNASGKWNCVIQPIKSGRGWFVWSANFSQDVMTIEQDYDNWEVRVEVNGKENLLKKRTASGDKYIPLKMRCSLRIPVDTIVDNIRSKAKFLQLSPDFSLEDFLDDFRNASVVMQEQWVNGRKKHYQRNTPFAEMLKGIKPKFENGR